MLDMPTLAKLIEPITPEVFLRDYYEKRPLLVHRKRPDYYDSLLTLEKVDRAITSLHLSNPDVFIANHERQVPKEEYTFANNVIDVVKLYQQFADGGSIVINQLDRFITPMAEFMRGLELELSSRFQGNIYLTPRTSQGFNTHYDSHDVFVMQIHGTKQWFLYDTPIELPFRNQAFEKDKTPAGAKSQEFVMQPGDMVYVPRGVMHDARTTDTDSLHITVGCLHTSWTEVVLESVARLALSDADFRRSLPAGYARSGFDRTEAKKFFQSLIQRVAEKADFDAGLDHFADDLLSTRDAMLEGQLEQMRRLNDVSPESRCGARPNLMYHIRESEEHVFISCYGTDLRLPVHAGTPARFALQSPEFTVKSLPGDLDDPGKVVLVKRLIREGFVRLL